MECNPPVQDPPLVGGPSQDDEEAVIHAALVDDPDGDGFSSNAQSGAVDCNNTDASVNPAAVEVCDDGIDNNCDGNADAADNECSTTDSCAADPLPTNWLVNAAGTFETPTTNYYSFLPERVWVTLIYTPPDAGFNDWFQLRYDNNAGVQLITSPASAGVSASWAVSLQLQESGIPLAHRVAVDFACRPYTSSTDGVMQGSIAVVVHQNSPLQAQIQVRHNPNTNWYELRVFPPRGQCTQGAPPEYERCDSMDNDCDGATDEDTGSYVCGSGPCFHEEPACINGMPHECDPLRNAVPEVCDGVDNDCDRTVDEDYVCNPEAPDCSAGIIQLNLLSPFICSPQSETDTRCVRIELSYSFYGPALPQDWAQLCADFDGGVWKCNQKRTVSREGWNNVTWWGNVAVGDHSMDVNLSCAPYDPSLPGAPVLGTLTARAPGDVAPWLVGAAGVYQNIVDGAWRVMVRRRVGVCAQANVAPSPEVCNQLDDDCDGETDEDNICVSFPFLGWLRTGRLLYCIHHPDGALECPAPDGRTWFCLPPTQNGEYPCRWLGGCPTCLNYCVDIDHDEWPECKAFGDADDNDPTVHHGAPELCDGKDNNQDGRTDEGCME